MFANLEYNVKLLILTYKQIYNEDYIKFYILFN